MTQTHPAVDHYIANAAPFAQPILRHLRALVHQACPEVVEKIKWGMPFFDHHGTLCHIAAFKQHCAFGFWKQALLVEDGLLQADDTAMGQFGRIAARADLPDDATLLRLIRHAAALNAGNKPAPKPRAAKKPPPEMPPQLRAALRKHKAAREHFAAFSPTQQREYSEWIAEAKTDATRQRRLETAIEWLGQGKPRNWKYLRK